MAHDLALTEEDSLSRNPVIKSADAWEFVLKDISVATRYLGSLGPAQITEELRERYRAFVEVDRIIRQHGLAP